MKRSSFVLVLLFFIFLLFGSCSFAVSINYNSTEEFNFNGSQLDFFDINCENYLGYKLQDIEFTGSSATSYYNKASLIYQYLSEFNNYCYIVIENGKENNYNSVIISFFNNTNSNYKFCKIYRTSQEWQCSVESQSGSSTLSFSYKGSSVDKYLINNNYTASNLKFYKATWSESEIPSMNLKFIPSSTTIKNLQGLNFYIYSFDRQQLYVNIGSLYNSDNYNNVIGNIYKFTDLSNFNNKIGNTYNTVDGEQVLIDPNILLYNQGYAVSFIENEYETPYYYIYFVVPGTDINNFSGEIINNDNNNNNLQPILQQNQENQDFWKKTYNDLFTLNSGDVNEVYTLVSSYLNSGDTPISIYETIFGGLNNQPDDFIIRWDDVSLNATMNGGQSIYSGDFIQANSINFSKLTRDNSTFGLVHFWIRVLAMFSTSFVLFITVYKCILIIFGVSTEFIDVGEEEKRQIGFINDWRDKK